MALDSTVGGTNSNSYVTRSEGDAYFADRLYKDAWDDADSNEKERALIMATQRIDQEDFDGYRASETQALKWPRTNVYIDSYVYLASDAIPKKLKDAVCELALDLLGSNVLAQSGLKKFDYLKIGPIELNPHQPVNSGPLPSQVIRLLRELRIGGSGAQVVRS
jgi:hypothetical protein